MKPSLNENRKVSEYCMIMILKAHFSTKGYFTDNEKVAGSSPVVTRKGFVAQLARA